MRLRVNGQIAALVAVPWRGEPKGAHLSGTSRDRNGASLSEEAQCSGPLERASLLTTLENILRKAPDTGMSP